MLNISQIWYDIKEDNIVADCVSLPVLSFTIDPRDLPAQQVKDEESSKYKDNIKLYNYED